MTFNVECSASTKNNRTDDDVMAGQGLYRTQGFSIDLSGKIVNDPSITSGDLIGLRKCAIEADTLNVRHAQQRSGRGDSCEVAVEDSKVGKLFRNQLNGFLRHWSLRQVKHLNVSPDRQ